MSLEFCEPSPRVGEGSGKKAFAELGCC